ncbi:type II toxin-antitoxin system ParD family antitoxin [Shinella zoogloeoides]|jgi:antitoxin ParD1/3/4|uniref:type II toxin-antitoxin system ParD family antitoxin n=1 Tax=Shinella zoogloeoides TaxID=352475 RepID=UPI0028ACCA79|nr:type II toxin-antitoxin system ParD family antitoxin [Shinella zoogloeoides]
MPQGPAVSLTKEQQALVDRLVRSGRFDGTNDVVSTGLRLLEEREREAARFLADIEDAIESGLASGDAVEMETAESLVATFRRRR